jgi:hypothetical protein
MCNGKCVFANGVPSNFDVMVSVVTLNKYGFF